MKLLPDMLLGMDYGQKRIGLAIAEEDNRVVLPLKEIENKNKDFVLAEIIKIIVEKEVKTVAVGLPLSLTGERGPKAQETQKFIDFLAANISVPIKTVDERMTSRAADTLGAGTKGSRDIGAAMVILEDYILRNPNSQ